MDSNDGSFASPVRAFICHTNPTTYWKYVLLQDRLTSTHKAGSCARNVANTCTTTCLSNMLYEFLEHSATQQNLVTNNKPFSLWNGGKRNALHYSPKSARSLSSCSLERLVCMISNCCPLTASATLSVTAPLDSRNKAEVPGVTLARTWSRKFWSMP